MTSPRFRVRDCCDDQVGSGVGTALELPMMLAVSLRLLVGLGFRCQRRSLIIMFHMSLHH